MDSPNAFAVCVFLAGATIIASIWLCSGLTRSFSNSRPDYHPSAPKPSPGGVCLRQVYPETDGTDTDIDIIAIHGLDTRSPDTWTWADPRNRDFRANWLQDPDMLPSKVDRVRIFTCDWPADLLQPTDLVQKTVEELALLLLDGIERRPLARAGSVTRKDRPILFIASCLGGIILLKALVDDDREEQPSLRGVTRGIVFLATPFRGTSFQDVAAWAEPGLKAWASIRGRKVNKLLKSVKGSTFDLEAIVRKFTQLSQHNDPPCRVFNFYELGKTSLPRKVFPWLPVWLHQEKQLVDRSSATLDMVPDPLPLHRPHGLMNKFKDPECPDYDCVAGKIQDIVKKIRDGSPLQQADSWIRDKHYTSDRLKIERLSGDPLSMGQCYINLAIVEQSGFDAVASNDRSGNDNATPQPSPFSLHARLKIETPVKNIQIELATLFDSRKAPNGRKIRPRRILISGRAGVGKTTLCKKMIHDFIHGGTWRELFDRILWIPLRTLRRKPDMGCNLEGLFLRDFFSNAPKREALAKALESALHATNFDRTLFILDGLDEISEGLDKENEMSQFLEFLLEQPNVIITSRPSGRFPVGLRPLDLKLETVGFYPDQVMGYIKTAFTDFEKNTVDPKAEEVQSFLQRHELVRDLVRIPIQLDALCFTWDENFRSKTAANTMTQLYEAIELKLWKKDIGRQHKRTGQFAQNARDRSEIGRWAETSMRLLEFFAFSGLLSDVINYSSGHRDAIYGHFNHSTIVSSSDRPFDDTLAGLSFLRTSDPSSENRYTTYHFLHLTFQEYFAARYFARQWTCGGRLTCFVLNCGHERTMAEATDIDIEEFLRREKYNSRYDIFWRFVAGLLQSNGDRELCRFFKMIESGPHDLLGPVHQRLIMHCLSETVPSPETPAFNKLREDLEYQLKQWLLFECNFSSIYPWEPSHLAIETEFPEKILEDLLTADSKDVAESVKIKILCSLRARPKVPSTIMEYAASYLDSKVSDSLKTAALYLLQSHHKPLQDSIPLTIAALFENPESSMETAAANALTQQSALPENVLRAIMNLSKESTGELRSEAVGILRGQFIQPNNKFLAAAQLLKDPKWGIQSVSTGNSCNSGQNKLKLPTSMLLAIVDLIKDPKWEVRLTVTEVLSRQSFLPEKILLAVVNLLKDPRWEVRSAGSDILSRRALPENILLGVVNQLKDLNWYTRSSAVATLLQQRTELPENVLQTIAGLLQDPEWQIRSAAAVSLRQQSSEIQEHIILAIADLLNDPETDVQVAAVKTLGGQRSEIPQNILLAVANLLKNSKWQIRSAAAEALGQQKSKLPENILLAIADLLNDSEEDVQSAAIEALGRQSLELPKDILLAISDLLKSSVWNVRQSVMSVLRRQLFLPENVLPDLVSLLKGSDWGIRLAAADALGQQRADLPENILLAVADLLKDSDLHVQLMLEKALRGVSTLSDERFYSFLVKMDSQSFHGLYGAWMRRSFSDHLTWVVEHESFTIDLPGACRHIPFGHLWTEIEQARESYRVPGPENLQQHF